MGIVRTLVRVMVNVAETEMAETEMVEETIGTTEISKSVIDLFHLQSVNKQ